MLNWIDHLILVPVVLPLITAAILMLFNERLHRLKFTINMASTLALLACAFTLFNATQAEQWPNNSGIYLAANWSSPFGIVMLVDQLSALLLLLAGLLSTAVLLFTWTRWSRIGVHFHSLFQFLLMGINGSFLTADLFNLFVFFEVMLAASYGLVLHGYNVTRIRAGMQYIVVNLVASAFFLIGIALVYAATGSLNMADIAAHVNDLDDTNRLLMHVATAMLAVAFLTKSAMWPLGFWLPNTYSAASPPVAAMLVLMTKIGIYVVLRLWSLVYSIEAGESALFGSELLFWGGLVTLSFGGAGLLASQEPQKMASYSAIISSGTLLAAFSYGQPLLTSAALFYLISSTLAVAAFMLLIELIERIRTPTSSILALTMEAFAIEDSASTQNSSGVEIPASMAFIGLAFLTCALIMAGLPPLSGFISKFSLFHELLNPAENYTFLSQSWLLIALILLSGLSGIISLMRFGVRTFWAANATAPRLPLTEIGPIYLLLALCIALAIYAAPVRNLLDNIAYNLHQPKAHIEQVLDQKALPNPSKGHSL